MIEQMNKTRILRERDITTLQRNVICRMASGSTMYRSDRRVWLDCAFEAVIPWVTFYRLRQKKLIVRDGLMKCLTMDALLKAFENDYRCKQFKYRLTPKGREWAAMEWKA